MKIRYLGKVLSVKDGYVCTFGLNLIKQNKIFLNIKPTFIFKRTYMFLQTGNNLSVNKLTLKGQRELILKRFTLQYTATYIKTLTNYLQENNNINE